MAKKLYEEADIQDIAVAIREKNGSTNKYKASQMAGKVRELEARKPEQEKTLNVNENGTLEVVPDEGMVMSKVTVNTNIPGADSIPSNAVFKIIEYNNEGFPAIIKMGLEGDISTAKYFNAYNWNYMSPYWRSVTNVILPTTITTIDSGAFCGMSSLIGFTGPAFDNILVIGEKAFELTNVQYDRLPSNITVLNSYSFARSGVCFTELPEGITDIKDYVFQYCSKYKLSKLPPNLVNIGVGAFFGNNYNCLTFEDIPASVKTIGQNAFRGNCAMSTIKFKGTPTSIGGQAFSLGTSITNIYVPWAEGAVANAPWGATNATIHYNTTYDADGNPIV